MKRKQQPISYAPEHRPVWRRLRRWCTCGLRWPCPDRFTGRGAAFPDAAGGRATTSAGVPAADPPWNAPTMAQPRIGRAGALTRAQQWRANGGRW